MREKYYITTPIFYPNGDPHIGHAYNAIATDAIARFQRSDGKDVFFLSGTDEHGLKMQKTAEKEGITPQTLADRNSAAFQRMLKKLNISNSDFIRTTEKRHYNACQSLWKKMEKAGDIYLDRYAGWYSIRQETYYDEKDTEIGEDGIRREKEIGSPVEWNEEESYFFCLSKYQERLLEYYEDKPDFIAPTERRNEVISFVRSGLRDLSISRTTFDWGIPVPGNSKHIMYVWIDALTNYLTAVGFPDKKAIHWPYWSADAHIIGKDIIRFHAVYWPAFLMSAGLSMPKRIFAHGFLLNRGEKMSKSVGNVVDPFRMVEHFGLDQVRYFFLREVPFGQDGSFSYKAIASRVNADLVNNLGNLAQRSLSIIAKNCKGRVPTPSNFTLQDKGLLQKSAEALQILRGNMEKQELHLAVAAIFSVITDANRYFAIEKPWALCQVDKSRFATILYITAEILRRTGIMLLPFIPQAASKLLDLLSVMPEHRMLKNITDNKLEADKVLLPPFMIFPRLYYK
ncbi:MAG: methionyl-tRNA synthetase [Candidatus Tokpelaia sp. JSC188]|nr:MAG: methionyl-tRNA synthetase [Candidatus Tokpelaia sp. JSC188]